MENDRGDSYLFDFEPNGISFGSKSKGKLSPRSYPIQKERKWKYSFLSASGLWNETNLITQIFQIKSKICVIKKISNLSIVKCAA